MGRKYSPAYADIYMADCENTVFKKCNKLTCLYLRYLDVIFGLWHHTLAEFDEFMATPNNHHSQITLKHNIQQHKVEFLDAHAFFYFFLFFF